MPKTFTADVGDVRFPDRNFVRPIKGNETLEAAKTVVGQVLEVDKAVAEAKLTGDETSEKLTVGGIEIESGVKLKDQDSIALAKEVEGELSLRKVKRMRDQGLLSASGAKILAANAVQAASARRPGLADEFRKTASAFFGDFGEGQGTLDESAKEKLAAAEMAKVRMRAIEHGFATILPDGTYDVTDADIRRTFQFDANDNINKARLQKTSIDVMNGDRSASTLDLHGRTLALKATQRVTGMVIAQVQQFGSVKDAETISVALNTGRRTTQNELRKQVAFAQSQGQVISSSHIKALYEAAEAEFKATEELVKSKSWQEINKKNADGIRALTYSLGVNANPAMAAQEAISPGSSKWLVELAPKWAEMSEAQRAALLERDPWARTVWNSQMAAERAGASLSDVLSGVFPDKGSNPSRNAAAIYTASHLATSKDGKQDPHVQTAIDGLRNEVAKGNIATLRTLLDPKARANMTPETKTQVLRSVANEASNLLVQIPGILADFDAYELAFDGKDFVPQLSAKGKERMPAGKTDWVIAPGMGGIPPELKDAAKSLNMIVRALTTYGNDPETGTTFKEDPIFKEAFKGMSPEDYANIINDKLHERQKLLKNFREKTKKTTISDAQKKVEEQLLRKQDLKAEGVVGQD
jgi:hypothetical protein